MVNADRKKYYKNGGMCLMSEQPQFIQELFNEQVKKYPHKVAVKCGEEKLTYEELSRQSNQLANWLREKQVGKSDPVVIIIEKSIETIISILGVLKAGAAFVPLDPKEPLERLTTIVSEISPRWIIMQEEYLDKVQSMSVQTTEGQPQILLINSQQDYTYDSSIYSFHELNSYLAQEPEIINNEKDLCYIFYTSGSTGTPKGVMGCHKSLTHFIQWEISEFLVKESDKVSQFAAISFDACLRDIFVPLCSGGTVCLPSLEVVLDHQELVGWIEKEELSIIHCVPSIFRQLLVALESNPADPATLFPHLRYILMAGEVLEVKHVRKWMNMFGTRIKLVNLYGSTETTMIKMFHVVDKLPPEGKPIPIGKGMKGAVPLILNEHQKLCGIGKVGEIYIRSPFLALGYYKKEEQTKQVFIQNPLQLEQPELVYRTGDLGKYLSDGTVEYVGRHDHQVKIRGIRVELAEIESILLEHDGIHEIAVVDRKDDEGDYTLYAFFTGQDKLKVEEIYDYCKAKLPTHMIPAQFKWLDKMPLLPNGKINRKLLSDMNIEHKLLDTREYIEPNTETEKALVEIWREVLSIEKIGIKDNFFVLGGHSLLAMQVRARISEQLKVNMKLKNLFTYPTIQELAAHLDELCPEKGMEVKVLPKQELYPLSHGQSRLWFLHKMDPNQVSYNMPYSVSFKGNIDLEAFKQALQKMVERHSILRTVFIEEKGIPYQKILEHTHIPLSYDDLSEMLMEQQETYMQKVMNEDGRLPFPLTKGPLLRAKLFRLGEHDYHFYINMHHIISDAWSLGVLIRDFTEAYQAYLDQTDIKFDPLELQYVDFASWQNEQLEQGALDYEKEYWLETLRKPLPVLNLPLDFDRPRIKSDVGATFYWQMDTSIIEQARRYAEKENVSLFMVLFTVYSLLLHRLTGDEDIIVGTPTAGRAKSEVESLIGLFINVLPIRMKFKETATISDVLHQVRERCLEAFDHQSYPFDLLIEQLQPERDLSRTPIFSTLFVLQNAPFELQIPNVEVKESQLHRNASKFDVAVKATENEQGIELCFEYSPELFMEETIQNMAAQFEKLLNSVINQPEQGLYDTPILSSRDQKIIAELNATTREYNLSQGAYEAFIRQAEAFPERTALTFEGASMSYGELHIRSNRLAHAIRQSGNKRNQFISILMDRSMEFITGIYGIMKAGSAYVPIDPDYPEWRIEYMLENSETRILLTKQCYLPYLQTICEKLPKLETIILIDQEEEGTQEFIGRKLIGCPTTLPTETPEIINRADDIVYMIYTSGSTGQPKGTMISHRALVNCMHWWQEQFPINEQDCVAQKTSVCFDASVYELFWPLRHGAKLAIIPTETVIDAYKLHEKLKEEKVTAIKFVPTLFNSFVFGLEKMDREHLALPSLRWIFIGGEMLSNKTVNVWYELFGQGVELVNQYGPTEATIDVTINKMNDVQQGVVPIGKPMANNQIYILDKKLNLCPVGVIGEIYIGGYQLAEGYYNDQAKTEAVFITNHFLSDQGEKLYRTGDLGRVLRNGTIECVGRADSQVKIRGYRMELGEIEDAFLSHPQVESAGVITISGANENKQLVAFFTSIQEDTEVDLNELKGYLGARLPAYMVPPFIKQIEEMPLTPNKKIDRKVLAHIALQEDFKVFYQYVAPETDIEKMVALIWEDILGVEQVGLGDHFFELGGHSLLLMQVHSRIRADMSILVDMKDMFTFPVLKDLAHHLEILESSADEETKENLMKVDKAPLKEFYELSHAQKRLWFLHTLDPNNTAYHVNRNLTLHGEVKVESFEEAFLRMIQRHSSLRTIFKEVDGIPRQCILKSVPFSLEYEDITRLPAITQEEKVHHALRELESKPFDLTKGPLLRALILRRSDSESTLLLQMHHIITDGWSRGVFVQELLEIYSALMKGKEPDLSPIEYQYVDYAEWQNSMESEQLLVKSEAYWLNSLAKPLPVLDLPLDYPRPPIQTYCGGVVSKEISVPFTESLHSLARRENVTMFMLLFSTYINMLHHVSGNNDLIVGIPVAGRITKELEPIIGFFVNTLAIRVQYDDIKSPFDLLQQVKKKCLEAYNHQSYPFDLLMERLNPERDMSRPQVFSTMFQYEGDMSNQLQGDYFTIEVAEDQSVEPNVKFDLDILLFDSKDHGLRLYIQYNMDLFKEETVNKLADLFIQSMEMFVQNLTTPFGTKNLLTEADLNIITDINQNDKPYPNQHLIFEEFVKQAKENPDKVALYDEQTSMTYGELHQRSNQVAHFLRSQGVQPNELIAIMMERSVDMVVGLYGILKAGAAYVGIDPEYPAQRIQYMLRDSGARVLLSKSHFIPEIKSSLAQEQDIQSLKCVLFIEQSHASSPFIDGIEVYYYNDVEVFSTHNLQPLNSPQDVAYMIYTSGSTGQPKGVRVSHAAILNNLNWHQDTFPLLPEDVVTQRTTICFDDSVVELFWPLRTGASLDIVSRELITDPERLIQEIHDRKITCMIFVPSLFNLLVSHLLELPEEKRPELPLNMVFLGGEALPVQLVNQWYSLYPNGAKIINLYGPTEAAVDSTCAVFEGPIEKATIGRPIANTKVYILNSYGGLCPVNVAGDLVIGGTQLAMGYHNKPKQTAEAFISNHLPNTSDDRLYRTGDLARLLPNGQIEYLGRKDNQVKVRGFRIELGEIEEVISRYEGVDQAIVVAYEQADGNNALCGYYTKAKEVNVSQLKRYLSTQLPYYMVPPCLQEIKGLPLLPNGKIDRQSLSHLAKEDGNISESEYVAPRNEIEEKLVMIWENVLHHENISVLDHFFDLGGHSLIAIQILNRIRKEWEIEIDLKDLFMYPRLEELAEQVGRLLEEQSSRGRMVIEASPKQKHYTLSRAQRRLWFMHQLNPHSPIYNVPQEIIITQTLDVSVFKEALLYLVMRHDVLRTIFVEIQGEPRQVIQSTSSIDLFYKDLTAKGEEEQTQFIRNMIRLSEDRPFNLEKGPLLRPLLYKLAEDKYHFYLNMHHIITDGWSVEILLREWITVYQALIEGEAPNLAPLPLQYADYAEWQEQELARGRWDEEGEYWLQKLAKPLPYLEFIYDYPRPEVPSYQGDAVWLRISRDVTKHLKERAASEGMSMYMLLLTGYILFLHQQTHSEDIIVGTPVAGRATEELESIVGFFVNNLAIRTQLHDIQTVDQLMKEVKKQCMDAYAHQMYPFDLLIEKVNPERDSNRSPIFSTMFTYQPSIVDTSAFNFEPYHNMEHRVSKFDLIANMTEVEEELLLRIEYNTDLFKKETIKHFASRMEHVLKALVDTPNEPIHKLDLLTDEDHEIYKELNDTYVLHKEGTIHALFEEQVTKNPQLPAVSCGEETWTYHELNTRANQIAHLLHQRGVTRNSRVAIMMDRGIETIASMLGVMKAGGAYVPIDPEYPVDRITHMLEDSGALCLITQQHLQDLLPHEFVEKGVFIENISSELPTDNFLVEVFDTDLAYMIYTSGSTGKPKGILVKHKGVPSLIQWKEDVIGHGQNEVTIQFASFSFDASILEIFGTLLNGEQLHILVKDERISHQAFADVVEKLGGTFMLLPTVFFKMLATYLDDEDIQKLSSVHTIIVAGEALPPEAVRAWQRRFGTSIRILNFYGPSEITVGCTAHIMDDYLSEVQSSVPIGRPFHNCKVYVLNSWGQICPINVVGEIYIDSVGLAEGYINLPDKTKEAFVPNPFSKEKNAKLYKSGDLARILPDGTIEYMGRADHQVKVRGFRIEIGEIEEVLLKTKGIEFAAVVPYKDHDENTLLYAYFTMNETTEPLSVQIHQIREYLSEKLPDYMIPSMFERLDTMPLSPSGKVDRKALAERGKHVAKKKQIQVVEHSLHEKYDEIYSIWSDILQHDQFGIEDNFFDIGGHSMLIAKVHSELKSRGYSIQMHLLFQYPTVKSLTEQLHGGKVQENPEVKVQDTKRVDKEDEEAVAIIGIGLRFSDANNPDEFWQNLRQGRESVREFPFDELEIPTNQQVQYDPEQIDRLVRVTGLLEGIDQFDPEFFGMTEREARLMDPQHRLFLECAWEAIEDAGYNVDEIEGKVSLYGGVSNNDYLPRGISIPNLTRADIFQANLMSQPRYITSRVSYKLNLTGESLLVDAACSTSLVAVHLACQSLLNHQSDYALAGAASIQIPQKSGYIYEPGLIMSPDGHCRAFDKDANGSANGNGVAVVYLKRLSDAIRDRDPIYSVIKGSAINNDGNVKVGFTAPSQNGQVDAIKQAHKAAGVRPDEISYVEAHGTATNMGDLIEVAALTEVFRSQTEQKQFCGLGSVKTNLGHLGPAAGMASLIKTALALKNKEIPPSLNFHEPNPEMKLEEGPLYVNTKLTPWSVEQGRFRKAGVHSFSVGGTNCHMILEEAP